MALVHLIYVSSASVDLSDDGLDEILSVSIRNNTPCHITGMLLYADKNFMQVLEGDESQVDATFSRIEKDPRHSQVMVIARELIAKRDFADWSMRFRRLVDRDAKNHPGWAPYFSSGFDGEALEAEPSVALNLLKLFAQSQES